MAKMIVVAKCYLDGHLYEPGDVFEYDGPQGTAFHPVNGTPLPPIDMYELEARRRRKVGILAGSPGQRVMLQTVAGYEVKTPIHLDVVFSSFRNWILAISWCLRKLWKRKITMQTLTIVNGQTASAELDLRDGVGLLVRTYNFFIPAHGVTVTVYLAAAPGGTFFPVNDGFGNDYVLQPSKFQFLHGAKAGAMKLVASVAVTGDKTFTISW